MFRSVLSLSLSLALAAPAITHADLLDNLANTAASSLLNSDGENDLGNYAQLISALGGAADGGMPDLFDDEGELKTGNEKVENLASAYGSFAKLDLANDSGALYELAAFSLDALYSTVKEVPSLTDLKSGEGLAGLITKAANFENEDVQKRGESFLEYHKSFGQFLLNGSDKEKGEEHLEAMRKSLTEMNVAEEKSDRVIKAAKALQPKIAEIAKEKLGSEEVKPEKAAEKLLRGLF